MGKPKGSGTKGPAPVVLEERYHVSWKTGEKHIGQVVERRPLKQFRTISGSSKGPSGKPVDLADLAPTDFEYYIHFPRYDRRLDEWVPYSRIDASMGPIKGDGPPHPSGFKRLRSEHGLRGSDGALDENGGKEVALERERGGMTKVKNINKKVKLGKYIMDAWYLSPYPDHNCGGGEVVYVCEFCLKYMISRRILVRHLSTQCTHHRSPPGKLIYMERDVSPPVAMYELDGAVEKQYCQNLCLLSKVFLDHKTLYYATDTFMFYDLCETDSNGAAHIVGYFSKEKCSQEGYNLACILTFPSHQRKGYGKLLISISYELTKRENATGSPEKPLSDLGKISYRSYWAFVILKTLEEGKKEGKSISVHDITRTTGIRYEDVTSTLHSLNLIKAWKGLHVVLLMPDYFESQRLQQKKKMRLCNPDCLTWRPPTERL
jgi:histone acetyltransferase MYST1